MRFKQIISAVLAISMCITAQSFVYAAESSFSSAADMIEDVILTAAVGVNSTSLDAAIAGTKGKISVVDDVVQFDSIPIGYWYADSSNTLWADAEKSSAIIQEAADGYDILPTVLYTLLSDVNNQLIENYVPTSDDWSKIVGKYDITLGDVTIPAEQWVSMEPVTIGCPTIASADVLNLTSLTGINGRNIGSMFTGDNSLTLFAWAVNEDGELCLQNGITALGISAYGTWGYQVDLLSGSKSMVSPQYTAGTATSGELAPYIKVRLHNQSESNSSLRNGNLFVKSYLTDIANTVVTSASAAESYERDGSDMRLLTDASVVRQFDADTAKASGFVYVKGSQMQVSDITELHAKHIKMFESYSCSKLVRGNTLLGKRLSKLDSLTQTDFLTIKDSGWYITDGSSIDDYIGNQSMLNAGDTADINAVAEVEPLMFKVIVPTTLPIYVEADGTVSTATNATVVNKSNAAVKITGVDITVKAESGWTLVQSSPSDERDAKEFTFTTSLSTGTELLRNEVLPFTYDADLSPMTEGPDRLDPATVSVTVDWAE